MKDRANWLVFALVLAVVVLVIVLLPFGESGKEELREAVSRVITELSRAISNLRGIFTQTISSGSYCRIVMKMRVRIRRESGSEMEVLEPVNVSQGGIGFESTRQYDPDEIVWVKMHYDPNLPDSGGMETRSLIVRAVPLPSWNAFSCGVQFLTA